MARSTALVRMAHSFLRTPHGKKVGTTVLRRAADVADRVTGSKHAGSIERARSAAERSLRRL